jgi:hypothetical protein
MFCVPHPGELVQGLDGQFRRRGKLDSFKTGDDCFAVFV